MLGAATTSERSQSQSVMVQHFFSTQRADRAADFRQGLTRPDPVSVRHSFLLFVSKTEVRPTPFSAETLLRDSCYYGYSSCTVHVWCSGNNSQKARVQTRKKRNKHLMSMKLYNAHNTMLFSSVCLTYRAQDVYAELFE